MSSESTLLKMRLIVGYLGEQSQYAWWPTAFFDPSSRSFLEPIFSKSLRNAQYHGVIEAARLLHDDHLNVGTYHLFRLPEEVEQDLYVMMQDIGDEEFAEFNIPDMETALNALNIISADSHGSSEGPVAVGSVNELGSKNVLQRIAGVYLQAFRQNHNAYPYLLS